MHLIITDITEMKGGFCVAGWDMERALMVRPLPNGHNWTADALKANKIALGAVVEFTPSGRAHPGDFPHSTEDSEVLLNHIRNTGETVGSWFSSKAPRTEKTIRAAFGSDISHSKIWNGIRQSPYIPMGTQCRSLFGLEVNSRQMRFVIDFNKLKVVIDDGTGRYQMAVSSHKIKNIATAIA